MWGYTPQMVNDTKYQKHSFNNYFQMDINGLKQDLITVLQKCYIEGSFVVLYSDSHVVKNIQMKFHQNT